MVQTTLNDSHESLSLWWYFVWNIALWVFPLAGPYLAVRDQAFFRQHRVWAIGGIMFSLLAWALVAAGVLWEAVWG